MRRTLIALAMTVVAASAYAHGGRTWEEFEENCSGRNFRFNSHRAYTDVQTIDAGALRSLKVDVKNSPVTVVGGSGRGYTIQVCKAAEDRELLAQIRTSVEGGELRTTGPDTYGDNDWSVAYRIEAPRGADIDVIAKNGPIAMRDLDGRIVANLRNGPLSLDNVSGNVDVTTANGPVSISGGSGTIKVAAQNGPLSVDLEGNGFNGTLDANTKNGPLSVRIPRDYSSGVVIEQKGRGPFACRAEGCNELRNLRRVDDDWDDEPRVIELGRGTANVHVSTVNGPVTVREK
jgi:hypothetical protein